MKKPTEKTDPLYLDGTECRKKWRGFRFHAVVKLVIDGKVQARPDPVSRRLTFLARDLDKLSKLPALLTSPG